MTEDKMDLTALLAKSGDAGRRLLLPLANPEPDGRPTAHIGHKPQSGSIIPAMMSRARSSSSREKPRRRRSG
jgi:hypothetical protein